MATIVPTKIQHPYDHTAKIFLWETVTSADTCAAVCVAGYQDKSVHVIGNFGTNASVAVHGGNIPASPTVLAALEDSSNQPIAITAASIQEILPAVYWIAPIVTLGTGEDLDIYLLIQA